jgi:dGTPase
LALGSWPSAEAQVAALSDDIAYNAHDIDDGLRAHLFEVIDLGDIPLVGGALAEVLKAYPKLDRARLIHETVRRIISGMVGDLLAETARRARRQVPTSADTVRALKMPLVSFSAQMQENNRVLQAFLSQRMYRNERVLAITDRARRVIRDLFQAYMNDPSLMPKDWREDSFTDDRSRFARQVCDFIAGMTDRYALDQHKRLFDLEPLLR